jgi:putative transposase
VLNRAALRHPIFKREKDFAAFETLLYEAHARVPAVRVLGWCIMNNHWHLLLWPKRDKELSTFMSWLTMTHAARYRTSHHNVGYGPVYQGRYKSFVIEEDKHLLVAGRYVERNALRAKLVRRAEDWRWSRLWVRTSGSQQQRDILAGWPVDLPANWREWVNRSQTPAEEADLRTSIERGRPFGGADWQQSTARRLGLTSCFRRPGRPKKPARSKA